MLRTVWAKVEGRRRLYLIDKRCDFVEPVKEYERVNRPRPHSILPFRPRCEFQKWMRMEHLESAVFYRVDANGFGKVGG